MNRGLLLVYIKYGAGAGLLITVFAWLKSTMYFSGRAPDLFITLVAIFFAVSGWGLQRFLYHPPAKRTDITAGQTERIRPDLILSRREKEVFQYLMGEESNKVIADQLHVEMSTLKTHINNIYKKLEVANRKELKRIFSPPEK